MWGGKKSKQDKAKVARHFLVPLVFSRPNLQDNNCEKNRLELFRGRLSNGQVSDRRNEEMREQMRVFDSGSRERERVSVDYLKIREKCTFYSVTRRV